MTDVLTPIAHWGWKPPYNTDDEAASSRGSFPPNTYITQVHSKSGLVMSRAGTSAHRIRVIGAHVGRNGIRYGARYVCYQGSTNVLLLPEDPADVPLCPRCAAGDRPVVYRLFDAQDRLLYIGSTDNSYSRYEHHRCMQTWWPDVARKEEQEFPLLAAARVAERKAIAAERPLHNCPPGRPRKSGAA
jgi:predicted GIY-YIG superfamily endonuclease